MPEYGNGREKNQRNMYVIGEYKRQLLDALKFNKDFQLSLLYKELPDPTTPSIKKSILRQDFKECVFDYAFVPGTATDDHIYVCCEVTSPYADGATFKDLYIYFYVFTPKMLVEWDTDRELSVEEELNKRGYIGNKIDMVIDVIDREINGLKHLSLGKITLAPRDGLKIFNFVDGYYGKQLTYTASDFNLLPSSTLQYNYLSGEVDRSVIE